MNLKRLAAVLVTILLLTGGGLLLRHLSTGKPGNESLEQAQLYHCPMHPTYTSDRPGECPICGMNLVPVESAAAAAGSPQSAVQGYAPVTLSENQQHLMGIITAPARRTKLQKEIRTVGRVAYDETRVHHVHTKFEGYIEEIFVNYVGQEVAVGQPLFTVYSPEVLATQNEYLLALKQAGKKAGTSALPGLDLVDSARRRMLLWDLDAKEIEKLKNAGKAPRAVTIYSPVAGFVTEKKALQGMRITPEDVLYDISDLSSVWIMADVYENDLPFIRTGEEALITTPYVPTDSWEARLTYVYPGLNEKTRTVRTRLELANSKFLLKPEMYATVVIKGDLGEGLVVPESAVLTTGERRLVFVKKAGGVFEPREVDTGLRTADYYEIRAGLKEGEHVVTGANFLLDSESKLKASISAMSGGHRH